MREYLKSWKETKAGKYALLMVESFTEISAKL